MHKKQIFLIMIVAMNLRLSVTAMSPLLVLIQSTLHVSSTITALLVTIPLLCFSVGSIMAPTIIDRLGIKRILVLSSSILIFANLARPWNTFSLILGAVFVGFAIALLNITIPTMIAQTAGSKTTTLTAGYSLIMNVTAAVGTAVAIPLATLFGWQLVVVSFTIPALITLVTSLTAFKRDSVRKASASPKESLLHALIHDHQAIKLALFFGLQSLIFYTLATWLPAIYQSLGASSAQAGLLLSLFQFIGVPASLVLSLLTNPKHSLYLLLVGYLSGLLLLSWRGIGWLLSAIILGFMCALMFSVALNIVATSSQNVAVIAQRSAISQSLGYLLAAVGPIMIGSIHDIAHSWLVALIVISLLVIATFFAGLSAIKQ